MHTPWLGHKVWALVIWGRETSGGKFLFGEELLIGAVTVPKLELNLPQPVWSQQVAVPWVFGAGGDGPGREQCVHWKESFRAAVLVLEPAQPWPLCDLGQLFSLSEPHIPLL